MKNYILALTCIFTLTLSFAAATEFNPINYDTVCIVDYDVPSDSFIAETTCPAPIAVSVTSPNVFTPVNTPVVYTSLGKQNTNLASPDNPDIDIETDIDTETDETTDDPDPCVTNETAFLIASLSWSTASNDYCCSDLATTSKFSKGNRAKKKVKRKNNRSRNKNVFPGSKAPKPRCAWSN